MVSPHSYTFFAVIDVFGCQDFDLAREEVELLIPPSLSLCVIESVIIRYWRQSVGKQGRCFLQNASMLCIINIRRRVTVEA